jgi:hypothetical protein
MVCGPLRDHRRARCSGGVVLELPAPGVEDARKAGPGGTDQALLFGKPLEGVRRGFKHGLVGDVLMRADEGA